MNRYTLLLLTSCIGMLLATVITFGQPAASHSQTTASSTYLDVITAETDDGRISSYYQSVFGPEVCTAFGDPFSPINSPWAPGLYTYQYRIHIPADYEQNAGTTIVRVELFDPDSINTSQNDINILHTQRWYDAELSKGNTPEQIEAASCSNTDRRNSCLINTTELVRNCSQAQKEDPNTFCAGTDDKFLVNPFWFVRVDENRGPNCNTASNYTPSMNTATLYQLYYQSQSPEGEMLEIPLASYNGQTGDPALDGDSSHNTDLKWVSPGAFNSFGEVPTNCGSPNGGSNTNSNMSRCSGINDSLVAADFGDGRGFEVDLSADTAGIHTDPITGERYLYLDVTTIDGSSENGFDIWAGPPSASVNIPAEANARNVYLSDNPNSRDTQGISVSAVGILPMTVNSTQDLTQPLAYIPASYAGQTLSLSLFDTDSGTRGPIYFYFDTIFFDPANPANSDYYVAYGEADDPDRCFDNTPNCNNKWVGPPGNDPSFLVKIPTLSEQCTDASDPDQVEVCTPFTGGRLMARYQGGSADTFVWILNGSFGNVTVNPEPAAGPYLPGQPFIYDLGYGSLTTNRAYTATITHQHPDEVTFTPALPDDHLLISTDPAVILYSSPTITTETFIQEEILSVGRVTDTLTTTLTLSFTTNTAIQFEEDRPDSTATSNFTRTVQIPEVTLGNTPITVSESAASISIPFTINPPNPYAPITLAYNITGGTATAGVDYQTPTGTMIIPAGQTTTALEIPLIDDLLDEVDETITLQFTPQAGGTIVGQNNVTITIQDDDEPQLQFNTSALTVMEDESIAAVTVEVTRQITQTGRVTVTTQSGTALPLTDFIATQQQLTFTPDSLTAVFTVPLVDDDQAEPTEIFIITLLESDTIPIGSPNQVTVSIQDNDDYRIYLPLSLR